MHAQQNRRAFVQQDQLVTEVARDQVEQIAPQEAPIFPLLSEAYFQDPEKAHQRQGGKDEMLGFAVEAGVVLLTPIVMTVTREVVEFVAGVVMTSVQTQSSSLVDEFVKKMFKKFRREGEAKGEKLPPPLTREQIGRVREIALEKARQLKLAPDQAALLADSLVGSLATSAGGGVMTTDTRNSSHEPRLNPFVFPSDTSLRFVLLVLSVLGSSLFIFSIFYFVYFGSEHNEANAQCKTQATSAHPINDAGTTAASQATFPQSVAQGQSYMGCMAPVERNQVLWIVSGVALLLVVAGAIYWTMPALKIRKDRLVALTDERAPGVQGYLQELCREAGLSRPPAFLVNPRNASASGLAFGRRGRRYVSLNVGLVMKFYTDKSTFRAVVLHELAHLRNADVDKAYFSVAIGVAFAIVALVPLAIRLVYDLVHSSVSISFVLGVTWRVVALAGLVYLTLAAVLRARELYADVRASVWDGPSGALARVLSAQQLAGEGRWRALRRFHPEPERRRQTIASTDQLVRMGFWDAFATGITAVVAVPPFSDVLGLIIDHSELLSLSTLAVLMGAPLSRVLAVLLVAPLAVGVVGLGAWRGAFVALARGFTPSGSGALALGLGLGLIAGTPLSLSATVSTGSRMDWGALLAPSSTTTLVVYAVLSALLLVGLVWLLRWISAGASAWLDVVTTRRSLRSIVSLSLVTAGLISVLWLSPLLWLFLSPNSPLELVSPSQLAYLQSPYILLALIALWVLPLAASRWQVKKVLPPATQWAFLDPSPQPLSSRHHNRFRLSWALKAGIIGGAALCALLLIARLWWISVPEGVKSTDQAQLAFFAGQVAAAAVMQTIVAAIVTIRVRWLGVLHGLFAAFVGGCVMAVGLLGLNVAFGGGIGASFAWITIAFVLNGGALMALAISGSVSAAASRTRRKQIRT